jgi:hypothetical protein
MSRVLAVDVFGDSDLAVLAAGLLQPTYLKRVSQELQQHG